MIFSLGDLPRVSYKFQNENQLKEVSLPAFITLTLFPLEAISLRK